MNQFAIRVLSCFVSFDALFSSVVYVKVAHVKLNRIFGSVDTRQFSMLSIFGCSLSLSPNVSVNST